MYTSIIISNFLHIHLCFLDKDDINWLLKNGIIKNINNIIASPTAAHPSLVDGFTDQFVQTGQRAALRCIAAGNPTPVVNWTLDGEPVKQKAHVSFGDFTDLSGDVISYVNITSVRLEDGGEYRCIVSNDVGEVEHIARLNVYGNKNVLT